VLRLRPEALIDTYPEHDFIVAEGEVSSPYMVSIHESFYRYAAGQIPGGVVVDAGCGTGFGSRLLTEQANLVIGVDLKPLLLRYGRQEYGQQNLSFAAMDAGALGLDDGTVDAIVVDELLEHLPDQRPFLSEAARVLKPNGVFICATVNGTHTFGTLHAPKNRNHYREYTSGAFGRELLGYFFEVEVLGQELGPGFERYLKNRRARLLEWLLIHLNVKHRIPPRLRQRVRSFLSGADPSEREGFPVTNRDVERSLYLVAVARGVDPAAPACER
jgi:SAM-dependent methyltransferase